MASLGVDGMVSGLDTTSLITKLMQVEAGPQTLLKTKKTQTESFVTALQGLNTRIASVVDNAKKVAKADSWNAFKATTSADHVTATTAAAAQPGSLTFTVKQVATAEVSLTGPVKDGPTLLAGATALTVKKADGTFVEVTPAGTSLNEIAKAINDKPETGVKATVVRVSTDPDGTAIFRMQFTGASTGTAGAFEVSAGDKATVQGGGGVVLDTATVANAKNAKLALWEGAGAGVESTYEQSSNTFTGLMEGVSVTISKESVDPVTLTVSRDGDALSKLAEGLVGALNVVLNEVTSRTATVTKTGTDGKTTVTGGMFSGDSMTRAIRGQMSNAMGLPVDGRSPSEVGVTLAKDGSFTFDAKKFASALAADPARVQGMVTKIADRVADVAASFSDPVEGALSLKISGQQSLVRDYGEQIEGWDRRLGLRRATLQKTYAALEVTLSNLQGQSSWLAGQLSGLSANNQ